MAVIEMTEPSAASVQMDKYNRSGPLVVRGDFSPPAGTHWAVVGCTLAGAVTVGDVPTLVAAVTALSEVTSVHLEFWGVTPSELTINPEAPEDPTHELRLYASSRAAGQQGYGADLWNWGEPLSASMDMSALLDTKFLVMAVMVPAELDETAIAALETAIGGVTGIGMCEHLIGSTIPTNVTGATLAIETRMRIDAIQE